MIEGSFSRGFTLRPAALRLLFQLFLGALALQAQAPSPFPEKAATLATLADIRRGGFVLYMRHGLTDNTKADRYPEVDFSDCATQRPLTAEGRRLAKQVGEYLRKARIPLGDIHSSPLCRAKESAFAAFGPGFKIEPGLGYSANLTSAQKIPVIETTRKLLAQSVPPGRNRVIVGHAPNLMDLMGYFPKEGTVVIFRPGGQDSFTYLASIPPSLWPTLLK